MNAQDVKRIRTKLDAKRDAHGVPTKYKDAYREGLNKAIAVLDRYQSETVDRNLDVLRRCLNTRRYLSAEKDEAYRTALRAAMSMLHTIDKAT